MSNLVTFPKERLVEYLSNLREQWISFYDLDSECRGNLSYDDEMDCILLEWENGYYLKVSEISMLNENYFVIDCLREDGIIYSVNVCSNQLKELSNEI